MTERIYISDIQNELHYKDRRSVRRWCRNNCVRILSDVGSNKHFVLRDKYEKAKNKNYYSNTEVISSSMNLFSINNNTEKAYEYRPLGNNEINFLNSLQNF